MKKTNRQVKPKMKTSQIRRFGEAKVSYEKMLQEITPFIPRLKAKELSTVGKWQTTASLSLKSTSQAYSKSRLIDPRSFWDHSAVFPM